MIERKKKIRLIQLSLLVLGILIIFFTYKENQGSLEDKIITEAQEKIKDKIDSQQKGDVFFNIEYSGLDLSGNRYVLKSEEASTDELNKDKINMKFVTAKFYFKDGTILNVISKTGIYNNKTLDMIFNGDVKADYMESKLYAQRAEYSNTNSFLTITEDVVVKDEKGTMIADKLIFDIKKQTLKIASFNNGKINANINLK